MNKTKQKLLKRLLLTITAIFMVSFVWAQQNISGKVVEESGEPLPGVSVVLQGTTTGTVTDSDGKYVLQVPEDGILQFSFVGMKPVSEKINGRSTIDITMTEDAIGLEEVVAVGYGTQKKVNLTGSVETISFKEAVTQPVTNSGQLLYGRFSGVQLTQTSGNAGDDASSIVIRGIGTFGSSTPLIVIDNIQYDDMVAFNNLNPSDIESVTVLKDASASAIYGARGANGVILVTTKKGSEKFEVGFNTYYGTQSATVMPEFLGAYDYATLMNEKYKNEGGTAGYTPRYTDEQMEMIRTGSNPDLFSNTNWADAVLQNALIQNHNLSISGGSKKTTYRLSLGYIDQNSIVKSKFNMKRYSLSLNLNSQVKDWLSVSSVTNGYWKNNVGPAGGQDAFDGDNGIIYAFQRAAPTIPLYYSNGEYGVVDGAWQNPNFSYQTVNALRRGYLGDYNQNVINLSQRVGLAVDITKNLSFETSGSANIISTNNSNFSPTSTTYDSEGVVVGDNTLNTLTKTNNFEYRLLNENILRYKLSLNEVHNFQALLGHSIYYMKYGGWKGSLSGFPTNNLREFDGGTTDPTVITTGAYEEVTQSFFGRINYDYKGKYLAEVNLRRDGSSKFGAGHLYGTFPSASAGWRISEESFMKSIKAVSNLKLRASWGISGNDRIDNYIPYQTYDAGQYYVLGGSLVGGVATTALANPNIKWEQTEQYDLGLDLGMLNNKLQVVADFFNRNSTDILYKNFPIPNTLGVKSLAAQNAASMINRGLELGANYSGNFGKVKYSIGANITKFLKNEVTGLGDGGEETISAYNIIRIGEPYLAYYGYQAIGIFQTPEEVAESPVQFGNAKTAAGDIKYADISGPDGVPDDVIDTYDRTVIGNPNPQLMYNFNGSFEYSGFDINFMFQGIHGVDRLLMGNGNLPMKDERSNVLTYWIDRWTEDNPSTTLPRVGGQNNEIVSSFYIADGSYLRLKSFEIGYSLPDKLINKLNISKLRVYVGGQNLLTFTGLKNYDPEGGTGTNSNRNVPLYKTYNVGLNLNF